MKNIIVEKSFEFAVEIALFARELKKETLDYELGSQLLRSGTSIGANISEAQQAQSRKDFISKMSIALKEAYETEYWLKLLQRIDNKRKDRYPELIRRMEEIIRMLTSIIKTTKENNN